MNAVCAYRVTPASRRAGRTLLSMRTPTLEGMEAWLARSVGYRRRHSKALWLERDGQPAHCLVLAPRKRGRPFVKRPA